MQRALFACINGGYYREQAMRIFSAAPERYEVDGLFFNMFGKLSLDYSGRSVGHCHACKHHGFGGNEPAG